MKKIPYRVTAGVLTAIMLASSMPMTDVSVLAAETTGFEETGTEAAEAAGETEATGNEESTETEATEETELTETETETVRETESTGKTGETETAGETETIGEISGEDKDSEETETAEETEVTEAAEKIEETEETEETELTTKIKAEAATTYAAGAGTYATELAPATYSVPMKMFKYSTDASEEGFFEDDTNLSMAGSCVKEPASVVIHEDGTATMTVKLGTVSFGGAKGWGQDWSIYQDFDAYANGTSSASSITRIAAQIDAYSRVTGGDEKYVSRITFKLPQIDRNGAYVHMYIEAMGSWQDALFAFDWKDATKTSDTTSATSTVEGDAVGGSYLASIGSATYDDIDTAMGALTEGKTLKLNGDAALTAKVTIAGGDIDLNGHTLDVSDKVITFAGNTTVSDSSTDKSGSFTNTGSKSSIAMKVTGNLTVSGITDTLSFSQSEETSTLVIEKSKVTGTISYEAGSLTIRDTKLTGKIRVSGGGDGQILMEGTNVMTADGSYSVLSAEYGDDGAAPANIVINGGSYVTDGKYAIEVQGRLVQVNGGYFKASKNAILGGYDAAGKRIALLTSGTYSGYYAPQEVSASNVWDYAVKVYNADGTLAGGLEADGIDSLFGLLQDGQTAVLEKDIAPSETLKAEVNATVDLNGHTIDGTDAQVSPMIQVVDKTLHIKDTSEANTGLLKVCKEAEDPAYGSVVCTAMGLTDDDTPVLYLENVNTYGTGLVTFVSGKVIVRGGYHDQEIVGFFATTATVDIGESTWAAAAETGSGAEDFGKLSAKIRQVRYSLTQNSDSTYSVVGTELGKAILAAEKIEENDCTKASWETYGAAFTKAYEAALEVSSDATEAEVTEAATALNTAMNNLVKAASADTFAKLNKAIAEAKAVDGSKYTTDSYKKLTAAITAAEKAVAGRASESDVTAAYNNLATAQKGLAAKTTEKDTEKDTEKNTEKTEKVTVAAPKTVKASSAAHNKVKVSWSKVSKASGYEVYQLSGKKYKKIATVKKGSATSYTVEKLTAGKKYTFKVRAYRTVDGKKVYSKYTKTVSAKPVPATVSKVTAKNTSSKKAKLTWKRVSGASGYEVYSATSKNGKYKKVTTVKKGTTTSCTDKKLKKNKTYYYKVRAYKTVNGKKVYGSYSTVTKIKIKK